MRASASLAQQLVDVVDVFLAVNQSDQFERRFLELLDEINLRMM